MARVTPEAAAKDIVHFAILGESGRTGGFFSDIKSPFLGNRIALGTHIMLIQQPGIELQIS
jgi:hypothetical protein